jgi:hypothetical protein
LPHSAGAVYFELHKPCAAGGCSVTAREKFLWGDLFHIPMGDGTVVNARGECEKASSDTVQLESPHSTARPIPSRARVHAKLDKGDGVFLANLGASDENEISRGGSWPNPHGQFLGTGD